MNILKQLLNTNISLANVTLFSSTRRFDFLYFNIISI
jgi:hypothetical protein